jgi:hypothetical protein
MASDACFGPESAARKAYRHLRHALTNLPVAKSAVYDGRGFILKTDGSKDGFGGALYQLDDDGNMYPIAFISRSTSEAETRYIPYQLELSACRWALNRVAKYTAGEKIELHTNCNTLSNIMTAQRMNAHHERWRAAILCHNVVAVKHIPGVENLVADFYSHYLWTSDLQGVRPDPEYESVFPHGDGTNRGDAETSGHPVLTARATANEDARMAPVVFERSDAEWINHDRTFTGFADNVDPTSSSSLEKRFNGDPWYGPIFR